MLIQRMLLGVPASLALSALADTKDTYDPSQDQQQGSRQIIPLAIRKMSLDVGEKFYPEQYYGFDSGDDNDDGYARPGKRDSVDRSLASFFSFGRRPPSIATSSEPLHERQDGGRRPVAARRASPREEHAEDMSAPNTSEATSIARFFPPAYLPPFSVHRMSDAETESTDNPALGLFRRAAHALARLQNRQWACPTGTSSCEDIGYPYSCCTNTEQCYKVKDTGLGPVGCCPEGETCGGAVADCTSDSTACPVSLGGGCCIAGYVCKGVGCVKSSATGTSTTSVTTSTSATTSTSTTTSTTVVATAEPTTTVVTVVVTETAGGSLTTRTTTITTTSTPSATTTSSSSGVGVAPVKPTLTTTASGLPAGYCPTGYYACLASAGGGCCQTGRNCQTTSCPPAASMSTIINTNGITVAVPATAAAAATTASATCASGWFLCGADAGSVAGCCPSGYHCGTASCSLTGASATTVQKVLATSGAGSSSGRVRTGIWYFLLAGAVALPLFT